MDIFKILAKGTSLEKSRSSNKHLQNRRIPSEGPAVRPQVLLEQNEVVLHNGTPNSPQSLERGVKRKRSSKNKDPSNGHHESARDTGHSKFQPKSEDQCKKILKSHKLKVSVLSDLPLRSNAQNIPQKPFAQLFPQPMKSFEDLGPRFKASQRLIRNVADQGYTIPTEVQVGSIPLLLGSDDDRGLGKIITRKRKARAAVDLLTVAPTGSGKTLAFLIPLIQNLLDERGAANSKHGASNDKRCVKALVLAPTHELVEQTVNEVRKLLVGTGLRVSAMRKGTTVFQPSTLSTDMEDDIKTYVKSDILVSTPLVLLHALSTDSSEDMQELPSITTLILDEADVLLDPLFREQTLAIWNVCISQSLQVSLWSATIGSSIESLTKSIIEHRRMRLGLSSDNHFTLRLIVGLKDSALPSISHRLVYTATEQGKLLAMRQMLHPSTNEPSSTVPALRPPFLVFTQTIQRARALHSELLYDIPVEAGGSSRVAVLHSHLSETARSDTMASFRKGEIWLLITTDLLARGMDFRGVNGVVNYDIPNTSAAYVHRAGRTGRAGREGGVSATLYTNEDIPYVRNIANVVAASEKQYGKNNGESALPKWLLDALPTVSKKMKQDLKWKGVAARRPQTDSNSKDARRMRISTKSGFDRRVENRHKATIDSSTRASRVTHEVGDRIISDDEDWKGLDD